MALRIHDDNQTVFATSINEQLRQLGVRRSKPILQQHVWHWITRAEEAPADVCIAIEKACTKRDPKRKVSRFELRPDVFGSTPEVST